MSERVDDPDKPSLHHHLYVAVAPEMPRTLGEFAGEANIAAGLEKKLGEDALWLLADSVFGYMDEEERTFFDDTAGIPIPVQFGGLRDLSEDVDDTFEGYRALSFEQLAVFTVEPDMLREIEQYYSHVIYDYPEVAVRLGQSVSLLETYEFNPRTEAWHTRHQRPYVIPGYGIGKSPYRRKPPKRF